MRISPAAYSTQHGIKSYEIAGLGFVVPNDNERYRTNNRATFAGQRLGASLAAYLVRSGLSLRNRRSVDLRIPLGYDEDPATTTGEVRLTLVGAEDVGGFRLVVRLLGIKVAETAPDLTAENARPVLTANDVEVRLDNIDEEREQQLRSWLEPLLGQLSSSIEDGDFTDPLAERRAERDRDFLHGELHETELGELRTSIVVQLALSIIQALAPVVDEPGASLAAQVAAAPIGDSYEPEDFIRQRDILASETGLEPDVVDEALTGFDLGLGVAAATATIYGAIEVGGEPGVLLGAVVAIIFLSVRARRRR